MSFTSFSSVPARLSRGLLHDSSRVCLLASLCTSSSQSRRAPIKRRHYSSQSPAIPPITALPATKTKRPKRIIVAVTGATGAPLAVALLHRLAALGVETHLIMSKWGAATLKYELDAPGNTPAYLASLAAATYPAADVSAPPSSGSFRAHGMVVVPCSMKTLAAVRMGYDADLISRAAGVTLKERRRLVLVARETPLADAHLDNMLAVTRAGAVVFPPVMAFYTRPRTVAEMVEQSVGRMVDLLDLGIEEHDEDGGLRWEGFDWKGKMAR